MTQPRRVQYAGLGEYSGIMQSLLRLMQYDVLVWNLLGKLLRGERQDTPQLILGGAANLIHDCYMDQAIRRSPEVLRNRRWVYTNIAVGAGCFLIYPTLATRRDYWAKHAWHQALFIQTWRNIALAGAYGGAQTAALAGPVFSAVTYTAAAALNGERFPVDRAKASRVANYTLTGTAVGLFIAHVIRTLDAAQLAADQLQQQRDQFAQRNEFELRASEATTVAKRLLDRAIEATQIDQQQRRDLVILVDELDPQLQRSTPGLSIASAVAAATAETGVEATLVGDHIELSLGQAEFLYLVLDTVFDNAKVHSLATSVDVMAVAKNSTIAVTVGVDDTSNSGADSQGASVFVPGHSLHALRELALNRSGHLQANREGSRWTFTMSIPR